MSFRTPLGRVRGLGSAKQGAHHWWMQRVTAVALVPLSLWFLVAIVGTGGGYAEVITWMRSPITTVGLLCLIAALYYHAQLGLQVVLEDYLHGETLKIGSILLMKLCMILLGVASALAVVRVGLGGPA
jgi:succinate dehydrogenase / fumarate reductase membrane anchor subunit